MPEKSEYEEADISNQLNEKMVHPITWRHFVQVAQNGAK